MPGCLIWAHVSSVRGVVTVCCVKMQVIPNFRVRTIPVLGTMPAIFGLAAASHILCELAQQPFASEPVFRIAVGGQLIALCQHLPSTPRLHMPRYIHVPVPILRQPAFVSACWRLCASRIA